MKRIPAIAAFMVAALCVARESAMAASSVPLTTLVPYVAHCQSAMGTRVMTGVIEWEHRGNPWPWVIGANIDATHHKSYFFADEASAVAGASWLYAHGYRNLDVGLSQLNTVNFDSFGLVDPTGQPRFDLAFDPCTNIRDGASILRGDYDRASRKVGPGAYALYLALRAYNTGSFNYGDSYARSAWEIAAELPAWVGSNGSMDRGNR